jgi:hypothetical protein
MRKAYLFAFLVFALGLCFAVLPTIASAQVAVGISVRIGPPALPVYAQPICPGPDYIWVPGYWAWDQDGDEYYWVPGTWVLAPEPGYYWTPGWWGFDADGDDYVWHPGYWGPHVGFYGGINYGFGYFGVGYVGGEWRDRRFYYNRAVTNVNVTVVRNVYVNRTVVRNVYVNNRVSYNGGPHGINARPTPEQQRWSNERHFGPTANQERHITQARGDRSLRYSDNHGRPPIAATQRPTQFSGPGVVRAGQPRNTNQFHPPTNQNRGRSQSQPNQGRPQQPNYQAPRNQPNNRGNQPNSQPRNQPNNRQEQQRRNYNPPPNQPNERGNPNAQPQQRPRNESQPRANPNAQPQQRPRNEAQPRGTQRPEAQPRNEQPRGNEGGGRQGNGRQGGDRRDGRD